MRMVDLGCTACANVLENHFQTRSTDPLPRCSVRVQKLVVSFAHPEVMEAGIGIMRPCGGRMQRVWLPTNRDNVIGDEIPGGLLIHNALCHKDGTPRRFYSQTEIKKAAKEAGWVNRVYHIGQHGTDKSEFTSSWAAPPVITEEERLAGWYAHERKLQEELHGRGIGTADTAGA